MVSAPQMRMMRTPTNAVMLAKKLGFFGETQFLMWCNNINARATFANITRKLRPGKPATLKICSAGGKRHWLFANSTNHQSFTTGAMNLTYSTAVHVIGRASNFIHPDTRSCSHNPITNTPA